MIPLDHDPGEAQVDWGEAQIYLDGLLTKVYLLCLRLCYSQRFFVMAFPRESQEGFFAVHMATFHELGGVPCQHRSVIGPVHRSETEPLSV